MTENIAYRSITIEVEDCVLAIETQTLGLNKARIIIEPREQRHVSEAEKFLNWMAKTIVIGGALYLTAEVLHAWTSGAVAHLVGR